MRVTTARSIQMGEVSPDRHLRLDALVNIVQETALVHTHQVGIEMCSLLDSGRTWVLSKMALTLNRLPELEETLEVQTWSRSIQRFKGFREFTFSVDGQQIGAASTLWLYLDIRKRKPIRVPDHYANLYGSENIRAFNMDLEKWCPPETVRDKRPLTITTRLSDFDVNGHVNNAVILQYIETAMAHANRDMPQDVRALQLAFEKEIPQDITVVEASLEQCGNSCNFQLGYNSSVFVSGTIETYGAARARAEESAGGNRTTMIQ